MTLNIAKSVPIRQPLLGLIKDSRTTDSWLGLLVVLNQDVKLGTTGRYVGLTYLLV
jgi:hypothetical protein